MDRQIYYDYFEKNILPLVKPVEKERLKTLRKVVFTSVFCFFAGCAFAGLFFYLTMNDEFNPILFPICLFCMYAFFIKSIIVVIIAKNDYHKLLAEKVLPLFLPVAAKFILWPKNHSIETVIDSKLFENFDTQEDNVSFFGCYCNSNIIISDTKLTLPVKGAIKQNLFKGTTIQIELDKSKSINNHVILLSKNESVRNHYKFLKTGIQELDNYLYTFEKELSGLKFITEDFWETVKKFGELFVAKGFLFSFKDNIILIALRRKKTMQFGSLFKTLLKVKNYDSLIDRFLIIFKLVELLNN